MLVELSAVSATIEYKIQSVIFSETTEWGDLEVTFVRCGNLTFEYGAYIDGEPVVMHLGSDGTMSQTTGINDGIYDASYNEFACSGNGLYLYIWRSA